MTLPLEHCPITVHTGKSERKTAERPGCRIGDIYLPNARGSKYPDAAQ